MKKLFLLLPVFVLSILSCQNQTTSSGKDNTMNMSQDSFQAATGMSDKMMSSPMITNMNKMMDAMHQMVRTGNIDLDFAMMMKGHHQGAVDMAEIELKSGEDTTLKQMAQKISDNQMAEMKELQAFIDAHKTPEKDYDPTKKNEGFAKTMEESMMMMKSMPKMDEHMASSADHQFVSMMTMHHQSAVGMAKGYLQYGKDAKMLGMAKKIIADQTGEIDQFKKWNDGHQ